MTFQGGESFPFSRADEEQSGQRAIRPSGFTAVDGDKMFSIDRDARFFRDLHRRPPPSQRWASIMDGRSQSGDGPIEDDEEDEDEDGDDDDEDVDDGDGLVSLEEGNNKVNYNSSGSVQSSSEKICNERAISKEHHSSFALSRGTLLKDGSGGRGGLGEQSYREGRLDGCQNIAVLEPEPYYAHILPGADGSTHKKEVRGEHGCGFSGRREAETAGLAASYWETLRTQLSDPIMGTLMDDAMILPCGHSFGNSGIQHVYKMKACYTCSRPISEFSARPNFSLRAAVQAFRREDKLHLLKSSRRKRDKLEQEKSSHNDSVSMDFSRGKGVQFPFAVSDKVIIKGNKRTPQRFVGRVAVVTTQCLNGWYVVKTLDNAESVKLQYRSLEKFIDDQGPNLISDKTHTPNWL
ncbi:U-box domain-containing protein 62-like isoform X1 [Canna indica]|uniref:U-box domain-containing protein 62-like isoform X1 n=1 Tax=Canna indica TaxID=4628 RepID=A0AAQ3QRD3_9LILI|nr:U-box domain-containing protein 62-like isoform X1 [Canna indica]